MMTVVSRPTSGLVALSAGGTGGHLFPAEALAQELAGRGFRIHLYTDRRVNRLLAGFPCEAVHEIASATFTARPSPRTIAAMARLVLGFFQARRTLRRTGPVAVVGFGGYPTLPPLLAALTLGLPTVIHEQNAVVGRANRLLARLVRAVATGFSDPLHLPRSAEKKLTVTGNPVREAARAMRGRRYEQPAAGGELRLVVFGGSQGASVFADVVPAAVADLPKPQRLRIVQQCRPEDLARVNEAYANHGIDHPEVQTLIGRVRDRRIVSYGRTPQAEFRLMNLDFAEGNTTFDVAVSDPVTGDQRTIAGLSLPMPGEHNALNAVAAIAAASRIGISDDMIRKGLAGFGGVRRRFTRTGAWNGITVYDDYGHHPVEIAAVLAAARRVTGGKVIAVMQPHRYTRLSNLFDGFCNCFNDADTVLVAPVYPAGEQPIEGANHEALVEGLTERGHRSAGTIDGQSDLAPRIAEIAAPGDIVVCLGAGTITHWAHALPDELAALAERRAGAA